MNHPFTADDWVLDALCREVGGDEWFADNQPGGITEQNFAKLVCSMCTVREQCLLVAIHRNERWGIWGGLSPKARDRERDRRGLKATPFESWHGSTGGAARHRRKGEKACARCVEAERVFRQDRRA